MVDFSQNRELRRFIEANQAIDKKQIADKTNKGGYYVIGPNPVLGGYDIKSDIGNVYYGVKGDTNQALGAGQEVSFYPGSRTVRIDARPALSNPVGSSVSDLASALTNLTNPTTGGAGGIGGGTGGAGGGRYRRNPDGSCSLVWGGPTLTNDYSTLEECTAGDPEGFRIWACEVSSGGAGSCKQVPTGLGKYDRKADCEAAIIQPAFEGGQCPVQYNVSTNGFGFSIGGSSSLSGPGNFTVQGPVQSPTASGVGSTAASWTFESGSGTTVIYGVSGPTIDSAISGTISVSRADGLPDNCGDPPAKCGV